MSNAGSCSNSSLGSPYGSSIDLMDDDEPYEPKSMRKTRSKKVVVGGLDLDDIENTVRSTQQDAADVKTEFNSIRNQSQSQTRRIHDLQLQFEEARVRIDKLLQRKSRTKSDYDMSSSSSSSLSSSSSHLTEINVNPTAGPAKPLSFGTVTLTVKVDEDE